MLDVFEIPRFPPSARNPSGLPPSIGETIQLSNNKFSSNTFKKCEKQFCKIQILCPSINGCFRTEKSLLARISFRDSVHCLCPVREAPFNLSPPLFGHCPFGGGGLNPCPDGLGHFFREEFFQVQMGICLILGGSKPLPGWFGALMQ